MGETRFDPRPRVGRILWITLLGNVLRYLILTLMIAAIIAGVLTLASPDLLSALQTEDEVALEELFSQSFTGLPSWLPILLSVMGYFAIFLFWGALTQSFLTMPTWQHYAETLRFEGTDHLNQITQRDRDESREAGGFAEALDVGATI